MQRCLALLGSMILSLTLAAGLRAETATVAVAANFLTTAETLAESFKRDSGHDLVLVSGSTGKLYAQIKNGAPFDVFLAADVGRPEALEKDQLTAGRKPYAFGRLVLLVRGRTEATLDVIAEGKLRIAIADPDLAPYGYAARQVLGAVRGASDWDRRLVFGQDVGQVMTFIATRNADAALVALAQLAQVDFRASELLIPSDLHTPIRQEAVLMERSTSNAAARAFYAYLDTPTARRLIEESGYGVTE